MRESPARRSRAARAPDFAVTVARVGCRRLPVQPQPASAEPLESNVRLHVTEQQRTPEQSDEHQHAEEDERHRVGSDQANAEGSRSSGPRQCTKSCSDPQACPLKKREPAHNGNREQKREAGRLDKAGQRSRCGKNRCSRTKQDHSPIRVALRILVIQCGRQFPILGHPAREARRGSERGVDGRPCGKGCEAEPCPCTCDPDNRTECREEAAADHAANGHGPRPVETELGCRLFKFPITSDCNVRKDVGSADRSVARRLGRVLVPSMRLVRAGAAPRAAAGCEPLPGESRLARGRPLGRSPAIRRLSDDQRMDEQGRPWESSAWQRTLMHGSSHLPFPCYFIRRSRWVAVLPP